MYICPDIFALRVKGIFERRWCPPKKLQLNSCQAKDKPPRPLRSERSRKADGTASSRIACQESTLWQCWHITYSLMSRFLRLVSRFICALRATKSTKESNYIPHRIFGLIKRDSVSCLMIFEKTNTIEHCTKTQPRFCAKRRFIKELLKNTLPKGFVLSI